MAISPSRRGFLAGSSGVVAASALAACSSNSGSSLPTDGGSGGESPTEVSDPNAGSDDLVPAPTEEDLVGGPSWTPPDLSGQEIIMWGLNYAPHVDRYNALANLFTEKTGCKVRVQPQEEPWTALMPAVAGGNGPDVVCLMGRMSDQYVKEGALEPLSAIFADLGIDNDVWWMPDAIGAYRFADGEIYGVPTESGLGLGNVCTVRTDWAADLPDDVKALWPGSVPEADWGDWTGRQFATWDDLYTVGAALADAQSGTDPKVWALNRQGWELAQASGLMLQLGTRFWDEQAGTFHFDDGACAEAFDLMVTTPYDMGLEAELTGENQTTNFAAGQVAIAIGNGGGLQAGVEVGITSQNFLLPLIAGDTPKWMSEGGWGFEMPKNGKNPEAGAEFIKFMTTYEAQFCFSQIYGGTAPACASLVNSDIYVGDTDAQVTNRRIMVAGPYVEYYGHGYDPQIETLMGEAVSSIRSGKMSASEAATDLQEKATAQQALYTS